MSKITPNAQLQTIQEPHMANNLTFPLSGCRILSNFIFPDATNTANFCPVWLVTVLVYSWSRSSDGIFELFSSSLGGKGVCWPFTVDFGEVKTSPTECKEKCLQMICALINRTLELDCHYSIEMFSVLYDHDIVTFFTTEVQ